MQPKSDAQLLREYADHSTETAFAEIVSRHANLVYSVALRLVGSQDIAAEIAQSVFIGLARGAGALSRNLAGNASLAGWLCRSAHNLSLKLRRDEFRRHSRERQAMENFESMPDTTPDWECLRPVLDEAMSELADPDYDALVMRYFKNQDLRSVGLALGLSDDAAQKRVSRALDKLRDLLSHRGITTSAVALPMILSANAVQAAPAGLAATISTAAALAGTTLAATTTTTASKTIAMTTLQKTLVSVTVAVAVGTGIYEARQASQLRDQVQTLHQQQTPLAEQLQQLTLAHDQATNQLAASRDEIERLNRNTSELLKLRGEVGLLRQQTASLAQRDVERSSTSNRVQSLNLGEVIPRENWRDAGKASPESAIQTYWWSIARGDAESLRRCMVFHGETNDVTEEYANHRLEIENGKQRRRGRPVEAISLISSQGGRASDSATVEIGFMHRVPDANDRSTPFIQTREERGERNKPAFDFDLVKDSPETNGLATASQALTIRKEAYQLTKVGDEWKISVGSPPPGFLGRPIGDPNEAAKVWSQLSPDVIEAARSQISPEAMQLIRQIQSKNPK